VVEDGAFLFFSSRFISPLFNLRENNADEAGGQKQSRFRVDGVPIDHMQSTSDTGVMSWLTSGRFDLVADIRFPREEDGLDLSALVDHLVDEIGGRLGIESEGHAEDPSTRIPGRQALSRDALTAPKREGEDERAKEERLKAIRFAKETDAEASGVDLDDEEAVRELERAAGEEEEKIVSIDLDVRFKDLKATVPVRLPSLSLPFHFDTDLKNNAVLQLGPLLR
jgi:distribution and morphology protein 31